VRRPVAAAVAIALIALPVCAPPAASAAAPTPADPSSPVRVSARLDAAFEQLALLQPAAAQRSFEAILRRTDLTPVEHARALRGLGHALYERHRRAEAAATLTQALEGARAAGDRAEIGWARRWLAALAYGDGRRAEARELWTAARDDFIAAGDLRGEFDATDFLGLITQGLDQRPLMERCLQIAVALDDPLLEARARRRWGQSLLEAARPGAALVELERAVALLRPLGVRGRGHLGDTLAVLGWALRAHGANDRAVPIHREALRVARLTGDVNARIWNNHGLGIALAGLGRHEEAALAMQRGLAAARETRIATSIRILTESGAWAAMMAKDWARAARTFEAASALPGVELAVTPVVNLARAYRHLGRLEEAIATATRAVTAARREGLVDSELRALIELAQGQDARGDHAAAEATVRGVVDRLEAYRAELAPVDFLKQGFGDTFADAYGLAVRVLMRLGRAGDALAAAERLRSRAFADLLAARRSREAEEADASSGAWTLGGAPAVATAAAPGVAPDSPRLRPAMDAPALAALAARLDTTIVAYWIQDEGSFAWVVQREGPVHGVTLKTTRAALARAVGQIADDAPEVAIDRETTGRATAVVGSRAPYRALHALLWAPLEAWLPSDPGARVTIVPHGPLFALPFGALRDRQGRYVVERFTLHHAASGAVLAEAAGRQGTGRRDVRPLVVADPGPLPESAPGARLPRLDGARAEARSIASLFTGGADLLVGGRASEAAVRARLPGARVAHFATHALVRSDDPLGSHLVLAAASDGDRAHDGRLTASEVAGLSLQADLVVLGACRSARGAISSDGIAGLTRAFMAAGAPAVVATLWDVPDEATRRLMTRFYAAYVAGETPDRALRAAQLGLLADLRAGRVARVVGATRVTYAEHPHLWAGTLLIGAP
jgi:CHAT domain-containing protein/tetratricopeptide (TPR) repeat protein